MNECRFILFVSNQEASARFYERVLDFAPELHTPGMTEFRLATGALLGLMPGSGIKRLLGGRIPDPSLAAEFPRAELYLMMDDPRLYLQRAVHAGATELSAVGARDWGHEAGYCLDPDGHLLAFARQAEG